MTPAMTSASTTTSNRNIPPPFGAIDCGGHKKGRTVKGKTGRVRRTKKEPHGEERVYTENTRKGTIKSKKKNQYLKHAGLNVAARCNKIH